MTNKKSLIDHIALAIAAYEGFLITKEDAEKARLVWPTRAQRNANPGNVRTWRREGKNYPTQGGFVDFVTWAKQQGAPEQYAYIAGLMEGWRVLRVLISQYIDSGATLREMMARYAPAEDKNNPDAYARFIGNRLGIDIDEPLGN
jgi:hypothetical protein